MRDVSYYEKKFVLMCVLCCTTVFNAKVYLNKFRFFFVREGELGRSTPFIVIPQ